MKILLLGDFSEGLDEGYKNISHYLAREISASTELHRINIKSIPSLRTIQELRRLQPNIIHVVSQPTLQSLFLLKLLSSTTKNSRTVVSALRPEAFFKSGEACRILRAALPHLKPDLILVQTKSSIRDFQKFGYNAVELLNGVDLDRFRPVQQLEKKALRKKYSLPEDEPIVLHVGHLHTNRNLDALVPLLQSGIHVAVVGSLYMGTDRKLINVLRDSGLIIFEGYHPSVEEFYQLSDCYIFQPKLGKSLSMPLSVLEAMACNLPVVSRRFTGLSENFSESGGLFYFDKDEEIEVTIKKALYTQPETRDMVKPYSWGSITQQLLKYYYYLVEPQKCEMKSHDLSY